MIEDLLLNLAAGLAQTIFEIFADETAQRLSDPQRDALQKVYTDALTITLRDVARSLRDASGEDSPADLEQVDAVLRDLLRQPHVRDDLLALALENRPLDHERMATRFRTVNGPDRLRNLRFGTRRQPFDLAATLAGFEQALRPTLDQAASRHDSPLHNLWTVGGIRGLQSGIDDLQRELATQRNPPPAPSPLAPGTLFVDIPAPPTHFFGRAPLLDDLIARLTGGHTIAISTEGLPGVGKTALAITLARDSRILDHFRDGVLWAGLGRTPDIANIQATWAAALGVDLGDLAEPRARMARLTNAIGDRRLLIILDDLWQPDAADHLRSSAPHVAHLLTTRHEEHARAFAGGPANCIKLPSLDADPSFQLMQALAPEVCAAHPDDVRRLIDLVGGLPLALELLGGYLGASNHRRTAARQHTALTTLADAPARLALATTRLGDAAGQQVTLQETIALSLEDLAAADPAAVAAFHALGAFAPRPATFDLPAALAVTQADEDTLITLADRNLVALDLVALDAPTTPDAGETLTLHQVLSDIARPHTPADAVTRHRDHYLARVNADREDWQTIEAIYPQIAFAFAPAPDKAQFVNALSTYQTRRGIWTDRLAWLDAALTQARDAADIATQALMLNNLGFAYAALGEKAEALRYFEQALPLYRQVGDKGGEAGTLNNIGLVHRRLGNMAEALRYYEEALPLRRHVGDKGGEATTLNNIGAVHDALGEKAEALRYFEEALPLSRQVGDKGGEATTLNNIGAVYSALGEKAEALRYYEEALPLRRQVGDRFGESVTCYNIAMAHRALGDLTQAVTYLEHTVALDEAIHHPDLASDRAMLEQVRQELRATQ